jgi:hypothetical protein
MKLTGINFDSRFGCALGLLHPGLKGYPEILCRRYHARSSAIVLMSIPPRGAFHSHRAKPKTPQ